MSRKRGVATPWSTTGGGCSVCPTKVKSPFCSVCPLDGSRFVLGSIVPARAVRKIFTRFLFTFFSPKLCMVAKGLQQAFLRESWSWSSSFSFPRKVRKVLKIPFAKIFFYFSDLFRAFFWTKSFWTPGPEGPGRLFRDRQPSSASADSPLQKIQKTKADMEVKYRPRIVDADIDCGHRFCRPRFRHLLCSSFPWCFCFLGVFLAAKFLGIF